MIEPKDKRKPPGKLERHFISPYPLYECRWRLNNRVEWPTKVRWRAPIAASVSTAKDGVIDFRVYRRTNTGSNTSGLMQRPLTRAYGTLAEQADGTTQVYVVAGTMRIGYLLYGFVIALIWVSLAFFIFLLLIVYPEHKLLVLLLPAALIGMIRYARLDFKHEHHYLMRVVEKALMDKPM